MPNQFANLSALLASDPKARTYYKNLPGYVQDHIAERGDEVNSLDSLISHADNATKGDD